MKFRTEPGYRHVGPTRTAVLLVNLGTPNAPDGPSLRRYLKEFLSDPRVVEIPRWIWWLILNLLILPFRPGKSAAKYAMIWSKDGSPLKVWTAKQASLLRGALGSRGHDIIVDYAMRYGDPSIASVLDRLKSQGMDRLLIVPLYPQYSATTTASSLDAVAAWMARTRNVPEVRFVKHFHDDPGYISALAERVKAHWAQNGQPNWPVTGSPGDRLVLSFHGVPKRTLLLGDPYHCECLKTSRLLGEALGIPKDGLIVSFQSRFGKAEWLQPYTSAVLGQLARDGVKRVDICCPGFPSDCLETLEEIAIEGKSDFITGGGNDYRYIPCLNDSTPWISALAILVERHVQGWSTSAESDKEKSNAEDQRRLALARGAAD